jgi:uncharacterized membrane protein
MYRSGSITEQMASFAHASVLAAGPCLLFVLCIWLIGSFNSEAEGHTTIAEFRVLVIYNFALSFLVASPNALVSARLGSDRLHNRDVGAIPGLMLAALGFTGAASIVVAALFYGGALDLDPNVVVASVVNCTVIAFVWVGFLFCSATRDYNAVTTFFAAGMLVAVISVTIGYHVAPELDSMMWGFSVGLAVTLFGLVGRTIVTFPFAVRDLVAPVRAMWFGTIGYWPIAVGGLFAATGAWVDKWVVWISPLGQQIGSGLWHAPLYDSPMFISYLVVIPAYAAFVIHLEVKFFRNYRVFYSSILDHATLQQIRRNGKRLCDDTIASLSGILVPQLVICALAAVSAPAIIDMLDMQFRQVGILRLGLIGAVFQFLFITCSSLTLYFDRRMVFMTSQACFLVLNAALTFGTLRLGPQYLGLGFLGASAISAAVAYLALVRTLYRLDYLTFIANNPAVRSNQCAM